MTQSATESRLPPTTKPARRGHHIQKGLFNDWAFTPLTKEEWEVGCESK